MAPNCQWLAQLAGSGSGWRSAAAGTHPLCWCRRFRPRALLRLGVCCGHHKELITRPPSQRNEFKLKENSTLKLEATNPFNLKKVSESNFPSIIGPFPQAGVPHPFGQAGGCWDFGVIISPPGGLRAHYDRVRVGEASAKPTPPCRQSRWPWPDGNGRGPGLRSSLPHGPPATWQSRALLAIGVGK